MNKLIDWTIIQYKEHPIRSVFITALAGLVIFANPINRERKENSRINAPTYFGFSDANAPIRAKGYKKEREQLARLMYQLSKKTEMRDGKPGISFEESSYFARCLGYEKPLKEGDFMAWGVDKDNQFFMIVKDETRIISKETIEKYVNSN